MSATALAPDFFPGFSPLDCHAGGVHFRGVVGGEGPPLLLLHGYPQTHIAWRRIAPILARHYTLVIPDLPGYGASRPDTLTPRWGKRRVGDALLALMQALGYARFAMVAHDRGARAGYRLALDHPDSVCAFASLTVVPTLDAMQAMNYRVAAHAFHWFFLAQEADLPERMLAVDPDGFLTLMLQRQTGGRDILEPAALAAYHAAFREPSVRAAMCDDYRAALHEDLEQDQADRDAGRRMPCPVLVLWPRPAGTPSGPTPLDIWQRWATQVEGVATGGGHLQAEDAPDEVLAALLPFLARHSAG